MFSGYPSASILQFDQTIVNRNIPHPICSVCSGSEETAIASAGHDAHGGALTTEETAPVETAEVTEVTEATEVIEEIEVAHEHEYESVVTEPTCTEQGYQRKFSLHWWSCDSKQ